MTISNSDIERFGFTVVKASKDINHVRVTRDGKDLEVVKTGGGIIIASGGLFLSWDRYIEVNL